MTPEIERAFYDTITRGTFTSDDVRTAIIRAGVAIDDSEAMRQELMETAEMAGVIRRMEGTNKWVKVV